MGEVSAQSAGENRRKEPIVEPDYTARTYTLADVRLVSMFARLEGAPATAEEILRDLDEKGKLSARRGPGPGKVSRW